MNMMKKMKLLMCAVVLVPTITVSMEMEDAYPFNMRHSAPTGLAVLVKARLAQYLGAALTAATLVTMAERNTENTPAWMRINTETIEIKAILVGLGFAAYYGYTSLKSHNKNVRLYDLVGAQTFLEIIQADNAEHAKAWFELGSLGAVDVSYDVMAVISRDSKGRTALMHAAMNGSINVARVLLDKGADTTINAQDKAGKTALMYALERNCQAMIDLLHACGA